MNSKKVVVFSTRKIQEEGIFKSFEKCNPNQSLKSYFPVKKSDNSVSVDIKNEVVIKYKKWEEALRQKNLDREDRSVIRSFNAPIRVLNYVINKCNEDHSFLDKVGNSVLNEAKSISKEISEAENNQIDNDELDKPYTDNIDASGKTRNDRVSLFRLHDNIESDYLVYAVYPLKIPCNDGSWVDALSNAIIEEVSDCDEIILLLHDNDLEETIKSTFHVLYFQQKYTNNNETITRSLGVFQHPDFEFHDILFIQPESNNVGKSVFNMVENYFANISKMKELNGENCLAKVYESLPSIIEQNN